MNKGKKNGPASWLKSGGFERPNAVQFSPDGNTLYVVDFGIMQVTKEKTHPVEGTGVLWKNNQRRQLVMETTRNNKISLLGTLLVSLLIVFASCTYRRSLPLKGPLDTQTASVQKVR